jgi:hypothetical protein
MKLTKITLKLMAFLALATFLCSTPSMAQAAPNDSFRVNIDRVFMHVPGDYSVAYTGKDKVVRIERIDDYRFIASRKDILTWISTHDTSWTHPEIKQVIIADVSHGEPMYAEVKGSGGAFIISIHIHSAAEIGGGEWSTGGKYPRNQDTVIVQ